MGPKCATVAVSMGFDPRFRQARTPAQLGRVPYRSRAHAAARRRPRLRSAVDGGILAQMSEATRLLEAAAAGDEAAAAELLPLVYGELRRLAAGQLARERPGQTLDATALVHEAYLRL